MEVLDQLCPVRTFQIKNYRPDWMTKELIEQIKDRDYFYKKAKKTGDEDSWNIAKFLRNVTNSNIRQAKREYVLEELKRNADNPKKFWKTIRTVIPSKKDWVQRDILLKDDKGAVDKQDVAQYINNYFINVGNPIPTNGGQPGVQYDPAPMSDLSSLTMDSLSLKEVGKMEVYRVVTEINTAKSSGLENINSHIIKEAFKILLSEVTFMYNLSIRSSSFPEIWKQALVVPIPKSGILTKVQNYRPISLLPLPGKIMEKLIHQQLSNHLESESLLAEEQHGFRKKHSTVHSIAQLTNYISKRIDRRVPTLATFIDFRKAFDCVQHSVLMGKLADLDVDKTVLEWVGNYLKNRKQRVYANSTYSSCQSIKQGVPQGSVLGPLFYIIYANDLTKIIKNCEIAMYADDTVLYISNNNYNVAVKGMQEDMDSLSAWCSANNIMANTDKTKILTFGSTKTLEKLPPIEIKLGGTPLQAVSSYKYLGITLDSQLNYNLHVSKIIGLVSGKLKQFRRMRSFLSTKAALMVYKGTILPLLEYGDIFLTGTSVVNRKRLQTLQNRGLRCALNKGMKVSSDELHLESNLLKLKYRREQHLLNYMYDYAQIKSNHKPVPKMTIKTRSQGKTLLKIRRPYTERYKKSLSYKGPKKWNSLTADFHSNCAKVEYKRKVAILIKEKAVIGVGSETILE